MYRLTLSTKTNIQATTDSPIEMFLQDIDVRANSRDIYRRELKQFVEYLTKREILEPTKQTIIEYKQYLIDEGMAPNTVLAYILAVKALYNWMASKGICQNITIGVKLPRINNNVQHKDALSPEQTITLLKSIESTTEERKRNRAIISTMIHTGLRSIEIHRANIGDLQEMNGGYILKIQGKGCIAKDDFVVITQTALLTIREYILVRQCAKPTDPLFASVSDRNDGERISTRSISRICKTALRSNRIDSKRMTCHSLRHTSITLALLGGSSLEQVQKMSRHQDLKTLQLYAHHIDRIKNAPENSIDSILGKVA